MPGRGTVRGRVASSPDTDTLYPKHIDSGAARAVTLCFGFCSFVRLPKLLQPPPPLRCHLPPSPRSLTRRCRAPCDAQLCFVLFYLVLALAIIPEMKEGDWQPVRCRAKEAIIASEPNRVRVAAP
jgi:hypothetical protein